MSHLLIFHLGPVQEFIAAARRTQDLWMGSWLLSHLSKIAVTALPEGESSLVLPGKLPRIADAALADVPNYFTARLRGSDPAAAACALQEAVETEWRRIANCVRQAFFFDVSDALWERQIENFLEIYWVIVPDDGGPKSRKTAQDALDARKRLRNFRFVEEPHQKCTLCGIRQEVGASITAGEVRKWWQERPENLRVLGDGSERLCAVCAVKRGAVKAQALEALSNKTGSFPSTSNVSAAAFQRDLLQSGRGEDALARHLDRLKKAGFRNDIWSDCLPGLSAGPCRLPAPIKTSLLTYDGDVLYLETFTEKYIGKEFPRVIESLEQRCLQELLEEYGASSQEELEEMEPGFVQRFVRKDLPQKRAGKIAELAGGLRMLYRDVRSDSREENIAAPCKYFAALMMDGDKMGAFFGKATETEARALSAAMSDQVVPGAKQIVESHYGRLVYAGGDDALALLPLETAPACARDLRLRFEEAVKTVTPPQGVENPTPSIGLAIAHHTSPLEAVLRSMRRAEHSAKNDYGRSALCVHALKRSGEEVQVGTHWQYGETDAIKCLLDLVAAFESEALSMKFAATFGAEARGLAGTLLPAAARASEIQRMIARHSAPHLNKQQEEDLKTLGCRLADWAEGMAADDRPRGIEEVAHWVFLARFLAQGGKDE